MWKKYEQRESEILYKTADRNCILHWATAYLFLKQFWMHAVNQMYSKHQSVGLDREEKRKEKKRKKLLVERDTSTIKLQAKKGKIIRWFYLEQGPAYVFVNQRLQRAFQSFDPLFCAT